MQIMQNWWMEQIYQSLQWMILYLIRQKNTIIFMTNKQRSLTHFYKNHKINTLSYDQIILW